MNYSVALRNIMVFFFVVAVFLLVVESQDVWDIKYREQTKVNREAVHNKDNWDRLQPVKGEWVTNFAQLGNEGQYSIDDLIANLGVRNLTVNSNEQGVVKPRFEDVVFNGSNVGLTKVCIDNSSSGFIFEHEDISILLRDIEKLESRLDITMQSLVLNANGKKNRVTITDLCMYMRHS